MTQKLIDKNSWHGLWTALVTPLNKDSSGKLSLDKDSFASLIESQIANDVDGLVIAGSTGEGSLLSQSLYKDLLETVIEINNDRKPLVAGLGISGTQQCIENAKVATTAGFDGLLISPPAYIKAPQRSLIHHYLSLAEFNCPICVYEIPGRSASSITIESIETLCKESKYICAVKDATADMQRAHDQAMRLGDKLALLSGDDFTVAKFVNIGGHGTISVASHVLPNTMKEIINHANSDYERALTLQEKIEPVVTRLFSDANPIPVKSLLHKLSVIHSLNFCEPLLPMPETQVNELWETFLSIGDKV